MWVAGALSGGELVVAAVQVQVWVGIALSLQAAVAAPRVVGPDAVLAPGAAAPGAARLALFLVPAVAGVCWAWAPLGRADSSADSFCLLFCHQASCCPAWKRK